MEALAKKERVEPALNILKGGLTPEKLVLVRATTGDMSTSKGITYSSPIRPTIHFSLNHMVEPHTMGSWESADKVTIIPMKDCELYNMFGGSPVDTFFVGYMRLPKSGETVRRESGEGDGHFRERVNKRIEELGYKVMPGGMWSWADSWTASEELEKLWIKLGKSSGAHTNTVFGAADETVQFYLKKPEKLDAEADYNLVSTFLDPATKRQFDAVGPFESYGDISITMRRKLRGAEYQAKELLSSFSEKLKGSKSLDEFIGKVSVNELDAYQKLYVYLLERESRKSREGFEKRYKDETKGIKEKIGELEGRMEGLEKEELARYKAYEEESMKRLKAELGLWEGRREETLNATTGWHHAMGEWMAYWRKEVEKNGKGSASS